MKHWKAAYSCFKLFYTNLFLYCFKDLIAINTINGDRWKDHCGNTKILSNKYFMSSHSVATSSTLTKSDNVPDEITEKVQNWTISNVNLVKKEEALVKKVPEVTLPSNEETRLGIGGQTQSKRAETFNKQNLRAPVVDLQKIPVVDAINDWASVLNVNLKPKETSAKGIADRKRNGDIGNTPNNHANNRQLIPNNLHATRNQVPDKVENAHTDGKVNNGIPKTSNTSPEKRQNAQRQDQNKKTQRVAFIPSGHECDIDTFKKYNNYDRKLSRSRSFSDKTELRNYNNTNNRNQNRNNNNGNYRGNNRNNDGYNRENRQNNDGFNRENRHNNNGHNRENIHSKGGFNRDRDANNQGNGNYGGNRGHQNNRYGHSSSNNDTSNSNKNPNNRRNRYSDGVVRPYKTAQDNDDESW